MLSMTSMTASNATVPSFKSQQGPDIDIKVTVKTFRNKFKMSSTIVICRDFSYASRNRFSASKKINQGS